VSKYRDQVNYIIGYGFSNIYDYKHRYHYATGGNAAGTTVQPLSLYHPIRTVHTINNSKSNQLQQQHQSSYPTWGTMYTLYQSDALVTLDNELIQVLTNDGEPISSSLAHLVQRKKAIIAATTIGTTPVATVPPLLTTTPAAAITNSNGQAP
jgi:hypothetical protein